MTSIVVGAITVVLVVIVVLVVVGLIIIVVAWKLGGEWLYDKTQWEFFKPEEVNEYTASRPREGITAAVVGLGVCLVFAGVSFFIGLSLASTGLDFGVAMKVTMMPWWFASFFGFLPFLIWGASRFLPYKDRTSTIISNVVGYGCVGFGLLSVPAYVIALMWHIGRALAT